MVGPMNFGTLGKTPKTFLKGLICNIPDKKTNEVRKIYCIFKFPQCLTDI